MRKIKFTQDENYHVYNRGNSKQIIFKDKQDYERFISLLYICNSRKKFKYRDLSIDFKNNYNLFDRVEKLVDILAYVQMPNHFHIIIHTLPKGGDKDLSLFIKKVSMGYSLYFNEKYNRSGSLFEGRFKATHLDSDNYFKYIFSYLHLNPIKLIQTDWKEKGIKNFNKSLLFLKNYKYSSFLDYLEKNEHRNEAEILSQEFAVKFFKEGFEKDILSWLKFKDMN